MTTAKLHNAAHTVLCLLPVCVLLVWLLSGMGAVASARAISNVASAQWRVGSQSYTVRSNSVAFDVAASAAVIETFRATVDGTTMAVPLLGCGTPGGRSAADSTAVEPARNIALGGVIVVRVTAPGANRDPLHADRAQLLVTVASGDRETFVITETGPDTGIFAGAVQTSSARSVSALGNCKVEALASDLVDLAFRIVGSKPAAGHGSVRVVADPAGFVFDSEDGKPVDGVAVTLVDAISGRPASVFADDGVTPWPARVITGQAVRDASGTEVRVGAGQYVFPRIPPGRYRLVIEPPDPWRAPSSASRSELATLLRPDGEPLRLSPASWGAAFDVAANGKVRFDVPLDPPVGALTVSKTVSRAEAAPGDALGYRVVIANGDSAHARRAVVLADTADTRLRLRLDSVRVDGQPAGAMVTASPDGSAFSLALGRIAAGGQRVVTYMMTVRPQAVPGSAENRAIATDSRGRNATGSATLRIARDTVADRMTVIGVVRQAPCDGPAPRPGVPGVRVMLEDGSYALTDEAGRFHFEGLVPGTHVVAVASSALPKGGRVVSCGDSTRAAGRPGSLFVMGQGGSVHRADFSVYIPEKEGIKYYNERKKDESVAAAGGDVDWLSAGDGPIDWLFPAIDHNARAPAVRVVIRHRPGQKIELRANGHRVSDIAAEGARVAPGGAYAVSIWRGIPLDGDTTRLEADVRQPDGALAAHLVRDVHFNARPSRVALLAAQSQLVADGERSPVLAVRVLDRHGRPVHAGIGGDVSISAPYQAAEAANQSRSRALLGLGQAGPRWTVEGDNGIARIALAPTMVSGPLRLDFAFGEGLIKRHQTIEAWIEPGAQQWTLVGLAQAGIGTRTIADEMERADSFESDLGRHARVAFYAKGRVLGRTLLTAAYDSAKQRADQRLLGAIDPSTYYTVFADGSERRHDAASRDRLYVRFESRAWYAAYGDFETGFGQTRLARYQRTMTGVKAEARLGHAHVEAFAAQSTTSHRHEEMPGAGITGPYRLTARDIIANTETVVIETRDRFRPERVLDRQEMVRFIDYDLDVPSATITFKTPVAGRDGALDPRMIVVEYDTLGENAAAPTGGVRADWTSASEDVRAGATVISEAQDGTHTGLIGLDLRLRRGDAFEMRAETATSRTQGKDSFGWLVEAERHDGRLDLLAYANAADAGFGLSQLDGAQRGRRKLGLDARLMINDAWSLTASGWTDRSLVDASNRDALQVRTDWRNPQSDTHLAIARFDDTGLDGSPARSTVIEAGSARRLLDGKLELEAAASVALGDAASADLPARQRLSARYLLTRGVRVLGVYEVGTGDTLRTRTIRGGVEATPWDGARLAGALGAQVADSAGQRTFAGMSLAQSVALGAHLSLDGMVDANRLLVRHDLASIAQAPSLYSPSTGRAALAESYTAVSMAVNWHDERWNANARAEWRQGEQETRQGLGVSALRQMGEGRMLGSYLRWNRARNLMGTTTESLDAALSAAWRPDRSRLAVLSRLELRSDAVTGAVAGAQAPAGAGLFVVTGNGRSTRAIASVSTTWSLKVPGSPSAARSEIAVFAAVRHGFDSIDQFDLRGLSMVGGIDLRLGLGAHVEVGGSVTVRTSPTDGATSFAVGPTIGISPAPNTLVTLGYNFSGFRDRDFSAVRSTTRGVFAALRLKFDETDLGLARR